MVIVVILFSIFQLTKMILILYLYLIYPNHHHHDFWNYHSYLLSMKSKWSSLLWVSKVQRCIGQIVWKMWKQCNYVLHTDGSTLHQYEADIWDDEINIYWNQQQRLPNHYTHPFHGTLEAILNSCIHQKRHWLASVWTAQEARTQERNDRNVYIVNVFGQWKATNTMNTM